MLEPVQGAREGAGCERWAGGAAGGCPTLKQEGFEVP